jgi:hypothetical protein
MAMRLAFAAAARIDPEVLLIDEVLTVGDERFAAKCAAWLDDFKNRGKTTILVSHSAAVVADRCDRVLWLSDGRVAAFGDPAAVIRAYTLKTRGAPVAEMLPRVQHGEAALAEAYRSRIARMLPLLRLPLVGYVRQSGVKGAYEDDWTDGALEFTFEALREVRGWTARATVPEGMPHGATIAMEVDGTVVSSADARPGAIALRCEIPIAAGGSARVRILSSATVNHGEMGISGDLRDIGARVDEITFDQREAGMAP